MFVRSRDLLLCLLCCARVASYAVSGDEHWSRQFNWPGPTNQVISIALNNGHIYTGGLSTGSFLTNSTLIVWDGIQWTPIGQFYNSQATLYDMTFFGGSLYVAGAFTNVNGLPIKGLARWDGSTWSSVGLTNTCAALGAEGNKLYVGGVFTNAGSVAMTNIGYWDGAAWHPLGGGLGGSNVRCLAVTNGNVYAGGFLTNAAAGITNIAMWNGSTWLPLGGGINSTPIGLTLKGTDLYVTGPFSQAGTTSASGIARWDGTNWFALGSGINSFGGNSVAAFGNNIYVAGSFTTAGGNPATNLAVWNGSSWSSVGNGLSAQGYKVLSTGSNVLVGGSFLVAGTGIVGDLATWDGSTWNWIGVPGQVAGLSSTVRCLATDNTNLYVGGTFGYAGQTNALRVGRYDGTNWYAFGTGLNSNVNALGLVGTNLYAGGDFTGGPGGPFTFRFARWNGSVWTNVNNAAVTSISTFATRSNNLFIAGYGIPTTNGSSTLLAGYDGTNLYPVLKFDSNYLVGFYIDSIGFTAMAIQDTNIYVSGHCYIDSCDPLFNCTECTNVIWFDGTYGRLMGSGLSSNANAIAVSGTDVYFGGSFTNAGGVPVSSIARWDGAAWHDVGGGIVGRGLINALAVIGSNLYAGGTFTNMGGVPANHIAKWNGSAWSALGSGTSGSSGTVQSLLAVGQDLYVGGSFRIAGNKPAYFLSRWNENLNFDPAFLQFSAWSGSGSNLQTTLSAVNIPTYVIDSATSLTNWAPLLTNSITPYDLHETNSKSFSRRFFRARSLP